MKITETLYVKDRKKWRAWLKKNHKKKKEIWLIYYKAHTGIPRIPYDDAVEEAICFGWIDSIVKRIDDKKHAQRFTPRLKSSNWSLTNIARAKKMIKLKKMSQMGLDSYKYAKPSKTYSHPVPSDKLSLPAELKKALMKHKTAWKNFKLFALSYQKLYIRWVVSAKRSETRKSRIRETVRRCGLNKKPNDV